MKFATPFLAIAGLLLFIPTVHAEGLELFSFTSIGGTAMGAEDSRNASLVAIINEQFHTCSGAFVAKNVVLTAAHCVLPEGEGVARVGGAVYPVDPKFGVDPLRGKRLPIEKIVTHPRKGELDIWIEVEGNHFPFDNPDLALLKLTENYDAAVPAELPIEQAPTALEVFYSGFGQGNASWQRPDTVKFEILPPRFEAIGADYADLTEGPSFDFMRALGERFHLVSPFFYFARTERPGQETLCYGDSGGPLYRWESGRMLIVGVASMFMPHPTKGAHACGDSYLNVFAKTAPHVLWLREEIERLSAERL